jgi:hypothetical protein
MVELRCIPQVIKQLPAPRSARVRFTTSALALVLAISWPLPFRFVEWKPAGWGRTSSFGQVAIGV